MYSSQNITPATFFLINLKGKVVNDEEIDYRFKTNGTWIPHMICVVIAVRERMLEIYTD